MDKFELQRLRDLPIEGVAERLGLQVGRGHKGLCPFHDDHNASLSFCVRKNTCRCFVCMDQSMGTIDLVMRHLGLGFVEACKWLADGSLTLTFPSRERTQSRPKEKTKTFDASRYEGFFLRPWLSDEARRFLFDERRLDPRVISWCKVSSWRDRDGVNWLQTPYYDENGKLIGVQNRNLDYHKASTDVYVLEGADQRKNGEESCSDKRRLEPSAEGAPRFRFPYGSQCGIYNLPVLKRLNSGDELWITEGCSDCWAMLSAGHKAIAIPSATLLSPRDKDLLSTLSSRLTIEFHMYPDQDVPGERLFLQLKEILPALVHHHLPPGCKDFSDYYVRQKSGHLVGSETSLSV